MEMGEWQYGQKELDSRLMDAPQLEQFTNWTFCRNSLICSGDSGWMKFFSFKNSKKAMKWPSSLAHRQYVNGMLRCMLCASRSVVAHRGHCSGSGSDGLTGDECSPINFMSFSVEPGESCRLSN